MNDFKKLSRNEMRSVRGGDDPITQCLVRCGTTGPYLPVEKCTPNFVVLVCGTAEVDSCHCPGEDS